MEQQPFEELEFQASKIVERLEEAVEKAAEAVNVLEQGGDTAAFKEEDLGLKGESWKTMQGFLQPEGRGKNDILKVLQDLIVFEAGDEEDEEPIVTAIAPLSSLAKLSLTVHTITAYCHTLDPAHLHKINRRIQIDVTRWITHLFRLYNNYAFYHDEPLEGLVRLTRMVLHLRYPKYLEDGYLALSQVQPVLYGEVGNSLGLLQHLCRQIGLPLSCINAIPSTPIGTLDTVALKVSFNRDVNNGRTPLLVLADAGSPVRGGIDDLPQLYDICKQQNVWLHVRGHSLAAFPIISSPTVPSSLADSYSLTPGSWLGLPGLPTITLYKQLEAQPGRATREATLPLIAGLVPDSLQKCLISLPLWFALQGLGREGIQQRIKSCFAATQSLWHKISKLPNVRILSRQPTCDVAVLPLEELMATSNNVPPSLFEVTCKMATTVVFQFIPDPVDGVPFSGKVPSYFDKLNSWMGQILQRDIMQVNVEMCHLENVGLVLRLCPLEGVLTTTAEHVESFYNSLVQQLEILQATVRLKEIFQQKVSQHPQLQLVEVSGWAGLGGVRYLPAVPEGEEATISASDLNKLNTELVSKLKSTDSAFSLGEGTTGHSCVRFGMVTADTDVEELLSLVISVGQQVEESAKYLDTMVEIVKKGIETATLDLQKETEDRIWQDGILRHVPVFGSIVNWWAPKNSESGIKGRSLNLQAGVVESTENIYRYHMQLEQGAASPPGAKPPPQPQVQTPIVTNSGAHSRSSSHTSQASNPPPVASES